MHENYFESLVIYQMWQKHFESAISWTQALLFIKHDKKLKALLFMKHDKNILKVPVVGHLLEAE